MSKPNLDSNTLLAATTAELDYTDVPADQIVAGTPRTGHLLLSEHKKRTVGVWEMTAGSMSDTETDEFFVVIDGAATVRFLDDDTEIVLAPGDVVQLHEGSRTIWTVDDVIRKVYVA
jgi:uncharacterized cupin superfamily protein